MSMQKNQPRKKEPPKVNLATSAKGKPKEHDKETRKVEKEPKTTESETKRDGEERSRSAQRAIDLQKRKEFLKMRKEMICAELNRPDTSYFKTLDSSVKKNTGFIRKLSTKISPEFESSLCKELMSLNLTRYIQEVVKELSVTQLKMTDIPTAIKLCSLLHKYYADFINELIPALKKVFLPEKNENVSRKRSTLRFLTELYTHGFYKDYSLILSIVENIVEDFRDDHNPNQNISLILSFVRYSRRDILGIERRSSSGPIKDENGNEMFEGDDELDPEEKQIQAEIMDEAGRSKFNSIIKNFFKKASDYLVKIHMKLREKERENREIENTKGELSEDIIAAYRKQRKEYDDVLSNMNFLSEQIQCDLPELPEECKTTRMVVTVGTDLFKSTPTVKESPLWDDEGMRSFYEDLEDLSIRVHPALLGLSGKTVDTPLVTEQIRKSEDDKREDAADDSEVKGKEGGDTEEKKKTVDEDDRDGEEPKEISQQDRLGELLQRLESCVNRDKIDQAAVDFCYTNSKRNRKKLVSFIFGVSRNKLEILPYYARLVATLNRYMKDVGQLLVQKLEQEFEQLYTEKHQLKIESKIKNIRFLSELVKFKVCAPSIIFKCLKMCLDDFVHHNVDVACALLETCGRFLYKTPETQTRTQNFLERMIRIKESKNFDNKQETMIENAYYSCKPPERPALVQKERPSTEKFMRKLIYEDLNVKTIQNIMRIFRKFDWDKEEPTILKILIKVSKCKFSNISHVASLVSGLSQYHEEFGIKVVDCLLEEIRIGLEKNEYSYNQKLISFIKFLGELYNYSLIDHPLIFDTLYNILGVSYDDLEEPDDIGDNSESPNDLFKIRLVCTLLETCGEFFVRGSTKERLDRFLAYFQKFILSQIYLSRDVSFMIDDMFEKLRPKIKRHKTYDEALKALEILEKKPAWGPKSYRISLQSRDDLDEDEEENETEETHKHCTEHPNDPEPDSEHEDESSEAYDEDAVGIKPKASEYIPCPEDDEFAKQYEQMMNEDREQRKADTSNRAAILNMSIPMTLLKRPNTGGTSPEDGIVPFKFLIKGKGNKQKAVDLCIPQDTKLASHHLKLKSYQAQQQEEIKQIVLKSYDERYHKGYDEKKKKLVPEPIIGATPYLLTDRGQKNQYYKSPKRGPNIMGGTAASQSFDQPYNTGIDEYISDSPRTYNVYKSNVSSGNTLSNVGTSPPKHRGGGRGVPSGRGDGGRQSVKKRL